MPASSQPTPVARPDTFYRDYAFHGGASVARRYGGRGTVVVYAFRLRAEDKVLSRLEAFGAKPADRMFCAKAYIRIELLKLALADLGGGITGAIDAEIVQLSNAIMLRGGVKRM